MVQDIHSCNKLFACLCHLSIGKNRVIHKNITQYKLTLTNINMATASRVADDGGIDTWLPGANEIRVRSFNLRFHWLLPCCVSCLFTAHPGSRAVATCYRIPYIGSPTNVGWELANWYMGVWLYILIINNNGKYEFKYLLLLIQF